MILSTIALYLTLAGCAVIVAAMVVQYDLYDREPLWLVVAAALLGGVGMYAAGEVQVALLRAADWRSIPVSDAMMALLAASTEEVAKLSVVILVALLVRKEFNDPLDGVIYGSFAGLGAALDESIAVLGRLDNPAYLPLQEPVRLSGHLIMGGIGGFGMGMITTRSRFKPLWIIGTFLGAMVLHFLWDVVAFSAADHYRQTGGTRWWHTAGPIAMMLAGLVAFKLMVSFGARLTREVLQVCDLRTRECP